MSRVLFINQCYWPDHASTAQHLSDLAEFVARAGHQVEVVCSRGLYVQGGRAAAARERRSGVDIVRLGGTALGKVRRGGRLLDYISFHLLAAWWLLVRSRADVIVTLTTPPLIGVWGTLAARLRGVKHVCFLMDLHPDAEVAHGMLRQDSLASRILEWFSRVHLRAADRCVVLGARQRRRVEDKGVDPQRIVEIPVWSDADEIRPIEHAANPLREHLGWGGRFVVIYSGNSGIAHRFEELLDAARELAMHAPDVLFAFVGGGERRAEIEQFVRTHALENVRFLDAFDRSELARSLSAGDVHFVSLREEFNGISIPGKLYGILAAGRPVLFVGPADSDTAQHLAAAEAGLAFAPGGGSALAAGIVRLRDDDALRQKMGERGRAYFLAHHERNICCTAWQRLLEEVAAEEPVPSSRPNWEATRT